jgi:hypothetical protein
MEKGLESIHIANNFGADWVLIAFGGKSFHGCVNRMHLATYIVLLVYFTGK